VGLFKPYDKDKATEDKKVEEPTPETGAVKPSTKKSIPTPTRKQAEQARRDRIQPVLTKKEVKKREKDAQFKARDEQMAKVNSQPYNVLIRDWVDRRWNLAEFALPGMLLVFVISIVATSYWPPLMVVSTYLIYAVFAVVVLDTAWMWYGLRKKLKEVFPDISLKRKLSYAMSRALLFRRSRTPAPRVKRGTKFVWPNPEDHR